MSLRTTLKRQGTVRGRRWIIKYNKDNEIREVKLLFNPEEYAKENKHNRTLYGDKALLKILDKNYEKTKINN